MNCEELIPLVIELLAKEREVAREIAARYAIDELELLECRDSFLNGGARALGRTTGPGTFTVDSASCNGTTVTITGSQSVTEPGEQFQFLLAELVSSGAPDPPLPDPNTADKFLSFQDVSLEAEDPNFDGEVAVWAYFLAPTDDKPQRQALTSPCSGT